MSEDWRVTATLDDEFGNGLAGVLREHELEDDARARLGERVAVSADSSHVFLYADTRPAAENAQQVVAAILQVDGRHATFAVHRWHPIEEEWEDADTPLPATRAAKEHERQELDDEETAESQSSGYAEWEVRLDLPAHRDAVELAKRLESEGIPTTRRWKYLLVGAGNPDAAQELATRLQSEAPAGTQIHVQPGGEMAWEVAANSPSALLGGLGPRTINPFAVFGGLGG